MAAHPSASDPDLGAAIDALYDVPPSTFVATRDRLAHQLRASGRRDVAGRVKALVRPSATAWAVNHAWWHHRAEVEAMLRAGESLRTAQLAALRGQAADLRAAMAARDTAVARVADVAITALRDSGELAATDTARRRITATLEALATSGLPEGVAPGRLTGDLASTGVDVLAAMASLLPSSSAPPAAAPPAKTPARVLSVVKALDDKAGAEARRREALREEARRAIAEAEAALADSERQRHEAQQACEEARTAAEAALARARTLEVELSQARDASAAAMRRQVEAASTLERAERARARAADTVDAARRRLAGLPAIEERP